MTSLPFIIDDDSMPRGSNISRKDVGKIFVGTIKSDTSFTHYFLRLRSFQKNVKHPRFTILVNNRVSLINSTFKCVDLVTPDTEFPSTRADEMLEAKYSTKYGYWKISIKKEHFKLYITRYYNPMKRYEDEFIFQ